MPIHTSWKSMVKSMLSNSKYCKRNPKRKCHKFSDGTSVCGCQGGWSVFFATVNKMGADDTKPMPKRRMEESKEKIVRWFVESALKSSDRPKWIELAQKVLASPSFGENIKSYWRKRLSDWCEENPKYPLCKGLKIRSGGKGKGLGKGKGKGPIGNPSRD